MLHELEPLIYVITGPMYSSKTRKLLAEMERFKFAGCQYQLFKPLIDNRYSATEIVDHSQTIRESVTVVKNAADLTCKINPGTEVIGIDEVHFFDSSIVTALDTLRKKGMVIYAAGLDTDFRRNPFLFSDKEKNMGDLLAIADDVEKRTAVCSVAEDGTACGAPARYTCRTSKSQELVLVGSVGDYIATCLKHHTIPE